MAYDYKHSVYDFACNLRLVRLSLLYRNGHKPTEKDLPMTSLNSNIFHTISAIKSASAPAHKAWATMRSQRAIRSQAANKAWETMRSASYKRTQAALKAWDTRRQQAN
jgi:hypothetical protein